MSLGLAALIITGVALILQGVITPYMQRRQMRQIERHREDPSAPLVPPRHPFVALLMSNAFSILTTVVFVLILVAEWMRTALVDRSDVFAIAAAMVGLVFVVLHLERR